MFAQGGSVSSLAVIYLVKWIICLKNQFCSVNCQNYWTRSSGGAHRVGLHGAECLLVGLVQVMSAVHLAPKAGLLPGGVARAKLRGDHPGH